MQAMSTSYACSKGQVRRAGQRGGKSTFKKEFVAFGETDGAVFGFPCGRLFRRYRPPGPGGGPCRTGLFGVCLASGNLAKCHTETRFSYGCLTEIKLH